MKIKFFIIKLGYNIPGKYRGLLIPFGDLMNHNDQATVHHLIHRKLELKDGSAENNKFYRVKKDKLDM